MVRKYVTPFAIRIPHTSPHKDVSTRRRRVMYLSPFWDAIDPNAAPRRKVRCYQRQMEGAGRDQVELTSSLYLASPISALSPVSCIMSTLSILYSDRDPPTLRPIWRRKKEPFQIRSRDWFRIRSISGSGRQGEM